MDIPHPASLSYPQLFSFQASYSSQSDRRNTIIPEGLKRGEWRRGILEVDFQMETFFIQDRDRIFLSQAFSAFQRHADANSTDDCSILLKFDSDKWEIAAQNIAEKACIQHLLECIINGTSLEDAVQSGKQNGILGLDRSIIKYGQLQRKAVNQKRLDERYLILVPGKLFVFKNFDIVGKHVRYVTSLLGATVRVLSTEQEFQILAPGSKTMSLVPTSVEDVNSWVEALGSAIEYTKHSERDFVDAANQRRKSRTSKVQRVQWHAGDVSQEAYLPSRNGSDQPSKLPINGGGPDLTPDSMPVWDANHSCHQEALHSMPQKRLSASPERETKEIYERGFSISSERDLKKQSRAMVCLENALDELDHIISNIRATRRPGVFRQFNFDRTKTDSSQMRSSRWKGREEPSWKKERDHWMGRTPRSELTVHGLTDSVSKNRHWQKGRQVDSGRMEFETLNRLREQGMSSVRNSREGLPALGVDLSPREKVGRPTQKLDMDSILRPISIKEQSPKRRTSSPDVRASYPRSAGAGQPSTIQPPTMLQASTSYRPVDFSIEHPKRFSTKSQSAEQSNEMISLSNDWYRPSATGSRRQMITRWSSPEQQTSTEMDAPTPGLITSSDEDEEGDKEEEATASIEDGRHAGSRYDASVSSWQGTGTRLSQKSIINPPPRQSYQAFSNALLPLTDATELSTAPFEMHQQRKTLESLRASNVSYLPLMSDNEECRPPSNRQSEFLEPYTGALADLNASYVQPSQVLGKHSLAEYPSPRGALDNKRFFSPNQYQDNSQQSQAPNLVHSKSSLQQHGYNFPKNSQPSAAEQIEASRRYTVSKEVDTDGTPVSHARPSQPTNLTVYSASGRTSQYQVPAEEVEQIDSPQNQSYQESETPNRRLDHGLNGSLRKSKFNEPASEQITYTARSFSVRQSTVPLQDPNNEVNSKVPPSALSRKESTVTKPETRPSSESRISTRPSSLQPNAYAALELAEEKDVSDSHMTSSAVNFPPTNQYGAERKSVYRANSIQDTAPQTQVGPTQYGGEQESIYRDESTDENMSQAGFTAERKSTYRGDGSSQDMPQAGQHGAERKSTYRADSIHENLPAQYGQERSLVQADPSIMTSRVSESSWSPETLQVEHRQRLVGLH